MKVAVVFSGIAPEGGGVHTFEESLINAMGDQGAESGHRFFYYVAGSAPGDIPSLTQIPTTRRVRWQRSLLMAIRTLSDLRGRPRPRWRTWLERSLDENGIEFVWFASHYMEDCDQPFMCTLWDLAHLETPWFPEVGADGQWERRQHYFLRWLPKATRVLVCNEAGEKTLRRTFHLPPERIVQAPMPTPEFALRAGADSDDAGILEQLGVRHPYLFYPAQFWAHKNHVNALRAFAELRRNTGAPFRFVLVGSDKGQLDHVRKAADEIGVAEEVDFLGFVERDALTALYRGAYALLYTSFFGPENLPPLEAFALGCPVVCADVDGMREQLGDGALFASPTDPREMAAQLARLGDASLRESLTATGREIAEGRTVDEYVRRIIGVLDEFEPVRRTWAT